MPLAPQLLLIGVWSLLSTYWPPITAALVGLNAIHGSLIVSTKLLRCSSASLTLQPSSPQQLTCVKHLLTES
ncbi:hypothetical protein SynROS8604_02250 [Synechococcus sp. ROS8604]|nr:hypothetical protein SynROS8604_02250 [Synechococcus sp. ROS8604]